MSGEIIEPEEAQPLTLADQFRHQFHTWEKRGRGWGLWGYPVVLEPPFEPLAFEVASSSATDDGRQPGLWEQLAGFFGKAPPALPQKPLRLPPQEEPEPLPATGSSLGTIRLGLPNMS